VEISDLGTHSETQLSDIMLGTCQGVSSFSFCKYEKTKYKIINNVFVQTIRGKSTSVLTSKLIGHIVLGKFNASHSGHKCARRSLDFLAITYG
jgi:hypothetical protein